MTDEEFRELHRPLHVAATFEQAEDETGQVVFALADLGKGSADEVAKHLLQLNGHAEAKQLIARAHGILTELYDHGAIAAEELNGTLIYNLHKITQANEGAVNPDLLAPGLD